MYLLYRLWQICRIHMCIASCFVRRAAHTHTHVQTHCQPKTLANTHVWRDTPKRKKRKNWMIRLVVVYFIVPKSSVLLRICVLAVTVCGWAANIANATHGNVYTMVSCDTHKRQMHKCTHTHADSFESNAGREHFLNSVRFSCMERMLVFHGSAVWLQLCFSILDFFKPNSPTR